MKTLWAGIVVLLVLSFNAGDAEAGKGLMIINTGTDVVHLSDIKEEFKAEVEAETMAGAKIGMMYSRFGVFWLDIWRWDKKIVVYQGDTVWDIPKDAAKEIAAGSLSPPFTMTLPPGLIILLVGGLGFVAFMFLGKDDEEGDPNMAYAQHGQQGYPPQGMDPNAYAQQGGYPQA